MDLAAFGQLRWICGIAGRWQFRHSGVSSNAELVVVLRRITRLVGRDDADTGWSAYEADELCSEIVSFLEKAEAGLPLDEAERSRLRVLFAPTGPLQERSISSGWTIEFLDLAARCDEGI